MKHSRFFVGFAVIKARKTALSSESPDFPVCILQSHASYASIHIYTLNIYSKRFPL